MNENISTDKSVTLEVRILRSNLSEDDKIELIGRLKNPNKEYIYIPQKVEPYQPYSPCPVNPLTWPNTTPWYPGRDVWYCDTRTDPKETKGVFTCECCGNK